MGHSSTLRSPSPAVISQFSITSIGFGNVGGQVVFTHTHCLALPSPSELSVIPISESAPPYNGGSPLQPSELTPMAGGGLSGQGQGGGVQVAVAEGVGEAGGTDTSSTSLQARNIAPNPRNSIALRFIHR
jgi:hypothetical protein